MGQARTEELFVQSFHIYFLQVLLFPAMKPQEDSAKPMVAAPAAVQTAAALGTA